uniref:Tc1-like transposase DDE domain-containing protein n=1 Tax=Sphaeramia orbicularis TaxID=375764 RepID=A0A673CWM2_9TELE
MLQYYINEVLESVLLPEARRLYPDGDWIFQQDGAPAHTANVTQTWLREHLSEVAILPPSLHGFLP